MKLAELFETADVRGTYAAAKFDSESKKLVADYIADNDIPNPTKTDKLHCTLMYSRTPLPELEAAGTYDKPMVCNPDGFDVWNSKPDEQGNKSRCLVLKLKCPEFVARHKELMAKHPEATYDHDEFKVHVTLSYNIGDMKIDDLPDIKQPLKLVHEYSDGLTDGWAKKNSKKSKT